MGIKDCILFGYINRTHGTQGEVVVILEIDQPQQFKKMESVFVLMNKQLVPFFIKTLKIRNDEAVILFEDINNVEEAHELIGSELYIPYTALPPLPGKAFYLHELKGYTVIDKTAGTLGVIEEVLRFPQQIIIQMQYQGKEVLFPHNEVFFKDIDKTQKLFYVDLPEGLIDIYM